MSSMEKLYSLDTLNAIGGGNLQFLHDFVKLFTDTTPEQVREVTNAAAANNWVHVSEVLHKMKPSIEMFEVKSIVADVKLAERLGKAGEELDKLPALVAHITEVLTALIAQLIDEQAVLKTRL